MGAIVEYASNGDKKSWVGSTFGVVDARSVEEEGLDRLLEVLVTENVAYEMVEWHFEENLQVTTQIFDEIRLRSRCHTKDACRLGKEVFGNHRSKQKAVVPIERHNAISK